VSKKIYRHQKKENHPEKRAGEKLQQRIYPVMNQQFIFLLHKFKGDVSTFEKNLSCTWRVNIFYRGRDNNSYDLVVDLYNCVLPVTKILLNWKAPFLLIIQNNDKVDSSSANARKKAYNC
jgi:hypothetical protein